MKFRMAILLALSPFFAEAKSKQDLRLEIETASRNEFDGKKHEVRVDDCLMTTFVWEYQEDETWLLWSSFVFDMVDASLSEDAKDPSRLFFAIEPPADKEAQPLIVIAFSMRENTTALHEMPHKRKTNAPEKRPSPRGDGTTHYYIDNESFVIIQEGPDVVANAELFTRAYQEYVHKHCSLFG